MIKPPSSPPDNLKKEIAALDRMSVGQLRVRYGDVFGEPARSGNRQWLVRRIAWRLQGGRFGQPHSGRSHILDAPLIPSIRQLPQSAARSSPSSLGCGVPVQSDERRVVYPGTGEVAPAGEPWQGFGALCFKESVEPGDRNGPTRRREGQTLARCGSVIRVAGRGP